MSASPNPYRLTRAVVPSAYRLFLTPDIENSTFAGRVEVDVDVREPTPSVTLHSKNLVLGAATLTTGGTSHRSSESGHDLDYETATFTFDSVLPRGPATLEIAFAGVMNDQLVGFYRSTYVDDAGVTHVIATTHFEHSDARQAFPCWDEPSFKATFQVNLTVPRDLATYSNSPVVGDVDLGNGQRSVSFAPTMKMSSYLVAFVVGDFEETAPIDVRGTPLRVVHPLGKGHLTELALDAGVFALNFLTEYFDIPYPGEKLDLVAIPDFGFGAMENLGCVTFRLSDLLLDPASASLAEKERIARVISHEIAHMWFGDLVTMEWWEGIWLNEAFATFMEITTTDAFRPSWHLWTSWGVYKDQRALLTDGLHSTRPIEFEIVSPDDTRGMFDYITYEKGGAVLRMLEQYLGPTVFRDGIRLYLRRHSYANTVTTDLWDALEEVSRQPVRDVMDSWIYQGGHPLVSLEGGKLHQQPFSYGPARGPSAIGSTWLVPVLTRSLEGGPASRHLLSDVPIVVHDAAPVVVNAGGSGVFRSRYGATERTAMVARLGDLEDLERFTFIADAWALLFAGLLTWPDFLAVARGMGGQDEPASWTTIATAIDHVHRAVADSHRAALVGQVRELFTPQFERLGWDPAPGDSERTPQQRAVVVGVLGTVGADEAVRAEAARRFEADDLDGDLAAAVLRVVAEQNRPGDYETFLERFRHARTPQEEQRYLIGLAGFSEERVALDAAALCFSEVRSQDAPFVLGYLSMQRVTGPAVWRYVTSRWPEALSHSSPELQEKLTLGLTTYFTDSAFAAEVEAFHLAHPVSGQRTVLQRLELLRVGLAFAAAVRQQF
ncbi:MAG: M1 family metallopeptidase [Acidimicrobiales bacterium]